MANGQDFLKIGSFVKEAGKAQPIVMSQRAKIRNMSQTQTIGLFRKYLLDKAHQYMQYRDNNFVQVEAIRPKPTCRGLLPYQNTARRPSFLEQELFPEIRNGKGPASEGQSQGDQLTIFYSGAINVYDNVPAEKTHAIMLLAGESCKSSPTSPILPRSPPTNASPSQRKVASAYKIEAGNLPVARKHSLQRFLEKRRDRIISKAPYASLKEEIDQRAAKDDKLPVEQDFCLTPCSLGCSVKLQLT